MTKCVAVGINHKQAIIVSMTGGAEKITHIASDLKSPRGLPGGSAAGTHLGSHKVMSKKRVAEGRREHLNEYYGKVVRAIRNAEEIFIFGPAQAKLELKEEILKIKPLSRKIVLTETAGRMTENQIVAKARKICHIPETE